MRITGEREASGRGPSSARNPVVACLHREDAAASSRTMTSRILIPTGFSPIA